MDTVSYSKHYSFSKEYKKYELESFTLQMYKWLTGIWLMYRGEYHYGKTTVVNAHPGAWLWINQGISILASVITKYFWATKREESKFMWFLSYWYSNDYVKECFTLITSYTSKYIQHCTSDM